MSNKKTNIKQIRKYLNGELDARAMFELEREAHNDPFLMDVIKGMESSDENHQPNLNEIDRLIRQRVEKDQSKSMMPLWKWLPVAVSLLIALGIGGWWLTHHTPKQTIALNASKTEQPDKVKVEPLPVVKPAPPEVKPNRMAKLERHLQRSVSASASISDQKTAPDTVQTLAAVIADKQAEAKTSSGYNNDYNYQLNKRQFGGNSNIQIRGASSIKNNNEPLYIVDGVPVETMGANTVDPSNIKSFNVIKDSSAKAIYGARAANGVVVITTKNGAPMLSEITLANKSKKYSIGAADTLSLKKNQAAPLNQVLLGRVAGVSASSDWDTPHYISGIVYDRNDHMPIPGASINIHGSQTYTQTDVNGKFTIKAPEKDEMLDVAYIGYDRVQVKVKSRDSIKVALAANTQSLSEVVVVGYGTQAKPIKEAYPRIGWAGYNKYLKDNATMSDGKTGSVKLAFTVDAKGNIGNIRIVKKGSTDEMDQKAITLLKNGSRWYPNPAKLTKEVELKISFHK